MAIKTIKEESLTAIGDAIRAKTGSEDLLEFPNGMVAAIEGITTGGGGSAEVEPIVLTGDQSYGCTRTIGTAYIKLHGDSITTKDLSNCNYLFYLNECEKIPFDINLVSGGADCSYMFGACKKLKEVPKIIGSPINIYNLFIACEALKEIPEDVISNFDMLRDKINRKIGSVFYNCYSLEKVPTTLLNELYGIQTSSSYTPYYRTFFNCYNLQRVEGLGVQTSTLTSNVFDSTFKNCAKLREFTFATNEDGTPKTANWRNQVIDLTTAGYGNEAYIIAYSDSTIEDRIDTLEEWNEANSAIYDDIEALPNVYATNPDYSLYNNARGALNRTLYSLPDCSEYLSGTSYTNTIKFGNHSVAGNIEAYAAAAAAKGWTVTLV